MIKQMPVPNRQSLGNYVMTVIVSAAMGAGLTWLITSQRPKPVPNPIQPTSSAPITNATPDVSGMSVGEAAVTLGNFAYDHQRWPEAVRRYQEAIANGLDNADVRTDLGNSFRFSAQAEQALSQYAIAQKQNPQHENSLFNQISLFTEIMNQPQRAI